MDRCMVRASSEPVYSVAMAPNLKYGLLGPSPERSSRPSSPPVIRAKPWRPETWAVFVLISWMAWVPWYAWDAAVPAAGAEALHSGAFDRGGFQEELSHPVAELQAWSEGNLRAYVDRLAQLQSSLERASGLSPSERRDLRERLLTRAAQVGLMLRDRAGAPATAESDRRVSAVDSGTDWLMGLTGSFQGDSGVLAGVFGGVVIAFALGNLIGYRRGARHASYYGEGDPRIRFLTRAPAQAAQPRESGRITLPLIREALADGRTVLLQLGYDVASSRRSRYLELLGQMQAALEGAVGLTYSAWEDPRHPYRFYELLVCRRPAALDPLTTTDGLLARLGEEIEACRLSGGLVLRRVWWSVPTGSKAGRDLPPIPDAASIRGGEN